MIYYPKSKGKKKRRFSINLKVSMQESGERAVPGPASVR
jgi:hypothetical protein